MKLSYPQFFHAATDNPPYLWQCRLAEAPACQSRLIDIPTGLNRGYDEDAVKAVREPTSYRYDFSLATSPVFSP